MSLILIITGPSCGRQTQEILNAAKQATRGLANADGGSNSPKPSNPPKPSTPPKPSATPKPSPSPKPSDSPKPPTSTVGRGLTYTAEEVSIWRERARSGPYRVEDDVQKNSPGDYERIKANTKSFLANPSGDRWNGGYRGGGCVPRGTSLEIMGYEPKSKGDKLKDAAFSYLLTEDPKLSRAVVDELIQYAKNPLINFSNRSRWCLGLQSVKDINPGFFIAEWVTKMLYAYDYVRSAVTSYEKKEIESWLLDAGLYFQRVNDDPFTEIYSDRARGIFKNQAYWSATVAKSHHNGYNIPQLAKHYNNRRGSIARMIGQVGLLLKNEVLKKSAHQFYTDWFKYAIFPDGTMSEYFRSASDAPEKGYHYCLISLTLMLETADAFAREGDTSLYDFVTGDGIADTKGGQKRLHLVMTVVGKMLDGTIKRYYPGHPGEEKYRINGIDPTGKQFIYDIWLATANMYFRDPYIRSIYLREKSGTVPLPSEPSRVGYAHPWSSTHGTLPGLLFMHGKMEGKVWPFPSAPGAGLDIGVSVDVPEPTPNANTGITVPDSTTGASPDDDIDVEDPEFDPNASTDVP